MNASPTTWHVLGAGAIGSMFAAALQDAGVPVRLLLRNPDSEASIDIQLSRGSTERTLTFKVAQDTEESSISHLLVTTKAYDVHSAMAQWAHRLAPQCQVVLLVNGMGIAQELQVAHPQLQIYMGTTTSGAHRQGSRHVAIAGRGETRIGLPGLPQAPDWFAAFAAAIGNCQWEPEIDLALWSKLAVNCVINPLTALHQCHNGELAQREELAVEVSRLCAEVASVCAAVGHVQLAATLEERVAGVVAATAENRSSMLQDVQGGRATEIEFINGFLLTTAAKHGIDVPLNRALVEALRERVTR